MEHRNNSNKDQDETPSITPSKSAGLVKTQIALSRASSRGGVGPSHRKASDASSHSTASKKSHGSEGRGRIFGDQFIQSSKEEIAVHPPADSHVIMNVDDDDDDDDDEENDDDEEDFDEEDKDWYEGMDEARSVHSDNSYTMTRDSSTLSIKASGTSQAVGKRQPSQRAMLLQGNVGYISSKPEAIQALEALGVEEDDDRFHAIQFEDRLVILTEELSREAGELSISVSAAQYRNVGECIKVTASSRGHVDGVPCGTTVTAYLTKRLLTLEQQHHEYIKFPKNPVDRKTSIVRKEDHYLVELFEANTNKRISKTLRHDEMRGVVPEGADLVLQRLIVLFGNISEPLTLVTIDSNLQWCHVTYCLKDGELERAGDMEIRSTLVERTIFRTDDEPITFHSYYTSKGHLIRRRQVGAPIIMRVKGLYKGRTTDEVAEKKVIVLKPLNWEEDLELQSRYCDRVEELKSVHNAYLRDHPDIQNILADFIQAVLIQRPDDILQFAARHFFTFSKAFHIQQQQLQQQTAESAEFGAGPGTAAGRGGGASAVLDSSHVDPHPHCKTTARLRYLIKALRGAEIVDGAKTSSDL